MCPARQTGLDLASSLQGFGQCEPLGRPGLGYLPGLAVPSQHCAAASELESGEVDPVVEAD